MKNRKITYNFFQKLSIIKIILLLLILALPLYAQQEMMVEDAIKLGLKNNYDIQIARNDAEIALNDKGKGIAGFLPVIDTSNALRYFSTNLITGSPLSFSESVTRIVGAQITLNWTLFDGFKMFVDRGRYNELAKLGGFEARSTIENTVVAIMQAFFDLVQQEQLLDVARDTLEVSKTRLEREEVRSDLGGASTTDLLNARVNFNNDRTVLLNQELEVEISRKELNILLAQDPAQPIIVKKEITIPPLDLTFDDLLDLARECNSDLLVARQNKIVAEKDVKIARSSFYPTVTLSGNYGYNDRELFGGGFGGTFGGTSLTSQNTKTHTIDSGIGLVLSFNLFNGNLDKIDFQNARIELRNQELALKNVENELEGLIREKYVTLQKRLETVEIEKQNVVAARQNLTLQQDRYRIGAADSLDFRDAQVNLARAQNTLIVASFQARITLLEIQQLIGKLEIE
jgi:outer membrane protein TolC